MWGIRGSYYNISKAIVYLFKATINTHFWCCRLVSKTIAGCIRMLTVQGSRLSSFYGGNPALEISADVRIQSPEEHSSLHPPSIPQYLNGSVHDFPRQPSVAITACCCIFAASRMRPTLDRQGCIIQNIFTTMPIEI